LTGINPFEFLRILKITVHLPNLLIVSPVIFEAIQNTGMNSLSFLFVNN